MNQPQHIYIYICIIYLINVATRWDVFLLYLILRTKYCTLVGEGEGEGEGGGGGEGGGEGEGEGEGEADIDVTHMTCNKQDHLLYIAY